MPNCIIGISSYTFWPQDHWAKWWLSKGQRCRDICCKWYSLFGSLDPPFILTYTKNTPPCSTKAMVIFCREKIHIYNWDHYPNVFGVFCWTGAMGRKYPRWSSSYWGPLWKFPQWYIQEDILMRIPRFYPTINGGMGFFNDYKNHPEAIQDGKSLPFFKPRWCSYEKLPPFFGNVCLKGDEWRKGVSLMWINHEDITLAWC